MDSDAVGEVVIPCPALDPTLRFFVDRLHFRILTIFPADSPHTASIEGHGLRLQLRAAGGADTGDDAHCSATPPLLRILCRKPPSGIGFGRIMAPNGAVVDVRPTEEPLVLPPLVPRLWLSRAAGEGNAWAQGRAGMLYRDLLPDRLGGRFIASHIKIKEGGPVPDYVHYHVIHFQLIFVVHGWVKVVYEDQGPPFVMRAGDCVLQPPRIRHRVLESSGPLEVVEVGSPAEHLTHVDHSMSLPTRARRAGRPFGSQKFVRHRAKGATWQPWRVQAAETGDTGDQDVSAAFTAFEARDTGVAEGSAGACSVRVARVIRGARGTTRNKSDIAKRRQARSGVHASHMPFVVHDAELVLHFVLHGTISITTGDDKGECVVMSAGDSIALPAGKPHALHGWSSDLQLLEVTSPAVVHWKSVRVVGPSALATDAQEKQKSLAQNQSSHKSRKSKL